MVGSLSEGEEGVRRENPEGIEHSEQVDPDLVQAAIPDTGGLKPESTSSSVRSLDAELDVFSKLFLELSSTQPKRSEKRLGLTEEDFYNISSLDEAELHSRMLELISQSRDIDARSVYARRLFNMIVAWLFAVLATVWASASKLSFSSVTVFGLPVPYLSEFNLSDSVLITLIGTTTANIIGLLYIVVNYMFPNKNNKNTKPRSVKTSA